MQVVATEGLIRSPEETIDLSKDWNGTGKKNPVKSPKKEKGKKVTTGLKEAELVVEVKRPRNTKEDIIRKVNNYIEHHYNEQLTLHMIAKSLYLNDTYLSRAYKKASGITITDCITNVRIEKAKKLIRVGDLKLYEIATSVGFKDPSYFTNVFIKVCGENPSSYKKDQLL